MKANYKNRVTEKEKKRIEKAVYEEYENIKKSHERKMNDRFCFLFMLGAAMYAHEALGYGPKRRVDLVDGIVQKVNELSNYLSSNTVIVNGEKEEEYDVEYNRGYLERLAKEYNIRYDEEIFDDEF